MKLPKLYRPVKIKFWTLRNSIGENMGVIFDCDVQVERVCMRVLTNRGWKWQIKNIASLLEWDFLAETDQEILTEHGSDLEFEIAA